MDPFHTTTEENRIGIDLELLSFQAPDFHFEKNKSVFATYRNLLSSFEH